MAGKKTVSVVFSDEQFEELERLAARQGTSVGIVLRRALDVNRLITSAMADGAIILAKRGSALQELVLPS